MTSGDIVKREREIFEGALDHEPGEARQRYAEAMCGGDVTLLERVQALLRAHEHAARFLPEQPGPSAGGAEERPGDQIGRYRLLEKVGEGGWGVVYRAEQETPVRREVALKIVKLGMDTRNVIARFEAERQALAYMAHPNIARVLDAGATDTGRPYFVMDFVHGVKITAYCEQHRLPLRARLELFLAVCAAVQHAHQKGIIHRDLKPPNILVTHRDGVAEPVVIDFGIAKATSGTPLTDKTLVTAGWQVIGTPAYMSPEQAWTPQGQDIDTRTDIYSLGVVLYELLAGGPPFGAEDMSPGTIDELRRKIREDDPIAPSSRVHALHATERAKVAANRDIEPARLVSRLKGDLDAIVLKCLEKKRDRRYGTASGLAMDLTRHLNAEPIEARSPGTLGKLMKFVRRNQLAVIVGGCVLLAAQVLLGVGLYSYWAVLSAHDQELLHRIAAEQARADADMRSRELEQVVTFQASMLQDINIAVMGVRLRDDLVAEAAAALTRAGLGEAEHAARMAQLDELLAGINFTNAAARSLEQNVLKRALDTVAIEFAGQPEIQAQLMQTVATTLYSLGLYAAALEVHEQTLEIRRRALGTEHPDTIRSMLNVGAALHEMGRHDEAEPYQREALAIGHRVLGGEHYLTLKALESLGGALHSMGRYEESLAYKLEAVEGFRRAFGEAHRYTLTAKYRLAYPLRNLYRFEESEQYSREVIEARRRAPGANRTPPLRPMQQLALTLMMQDKFDEAEPYIRETLELSRRIYGDAHSYTLESVQYMAALLQAQGNFEEAIRYHWETLEKARQSPSDNQRTIYFTLRRMGGSLSALGAYEEAETHIREALEFGLRHFGPEHQFHGEVLSQLGETLRLQGRLEEAGAVLHEAMELRHRTLDKDHPHLFNSLHNLARLYRDKAEVDTAEVYFRDAVEFGRSVLGENHPHTRDAARELDSLLHEQER